MAARRNRHRKRDEPRSAEKDSTPEGGGEQRDLLTGNDDPGEDTRGESTAPAGSGEPSAEDEDAGEAPVTDPLDAELDRARTLVADGRIEEAVEAYRALVAREPRSVRARNNLGVLYDELGQDQLALEQFESAREIEAENVEVLANLGASLGKVGRFEEAEREMRRAQRLDPEAIAPRANLGILYYRRGLYAQAEAELRWVCARDHDHGPAHYYRGESLNRVGRVDDAIETLERAVQLQPENGRAFYTLGILFDRKHMPQEAARMYKRARELSRS